MKCKTDNFLFHFFTTLLNPLTLNLLKNQKWLAFGKWDQAHPDSWTRLNTICWLLNFKFLSLMTTPKMEDNLLNFIKWNNPHTFLELSIINFGDIKLDVQTGLALYCWQRLINFDSYRLRVHHKVKVYRNITIFAMIPHLYCWFDCIHKLYFIYLSSSIKGSNSIKH